MALNEIPQFSFDPNGGTRDGLVTFTDNPLTQKTSWNYTFRPGESICITHESLTMALSGNRGIYALQYDPLGELTTLGFWIFRNLAQVASFHAADITRDTADIIIANARPETDTLVFICPGQSMAEMKHGKDAIQSTPLTLEDDGSYGVNFPVLPDTLNIRVAMRPGMITIATDIAPVRTVNADFNRWITSPASFFKNPGPVRAAELIRSATH